ncbi:hypothetical protein QR77_06870 [Streptomyces sp. 150FB]|uniref:hypothetical protein n=1 Tax=Streptomyces sp. 150FB TaxID=1576605 RepID=UPI0005890EB4|nr:hypothetical protein [Streptomyces sp. 150FB]KIF73781.1 hypothetical protein QR77_06870 [Streptomyces sp. 150FB]
MRPARVSLLCALALLVPLTPLTLGGQAVAADPGPARDSGDVRDVLTVANPGFEQGTTGWTFSAGSGVSTDKPHGGTKVAHLAVGKGGIGGKATQTLRAPRAGTYDISAWIATGGAGGTYAVRVNGASAGSLALPARPGYARYTVSRVRVRAGDSLEIAFTSGGGTDVWADADDVMVSPAAPVDPVVTSSDPKITAMFDWAKRKANSWTQLPGAVGPLNVDENNLPGTGTAAYGPSYWAGYANRSGYYARDMAHQLAGASVLGLGAANKSMLSSFAASATAGQKFFPDWSFNFDARTPLSIDYHGPDDFVREVPAPFELVEKAAEAYRWSGDPAYVDDPALWDFYRHATGQFITLHDSTKPNGVAEGTGDGIFAGSASYNEQGDEHLAEAGDAIGAQYQAFLAMSELASGKGDRALSADFAKKAKDLKAYFNSTWSGDGSGADMVRAYTTDGQPLTGWGKENSWFMPMDRIIAPGVRNDAYLDFVDQQASGDGKPDNIEALTYLPDTFFNNNRPDTAWKWMNYIYDHKDVQHVNAAQGPNGDYPEVSFTLLSQTVGGLMGVTPDAPDHALTTQSRLPTGMRTLRVAGLRIGGNTFTLSHEGATGSTLANTSGTGSYTWEARFPGTYSSVVVNGVARPARTEVVDGVTYTYVRPKVAPGATVKVEVR